MLASKLPNTLIVCFCFFSLSVMAKGEEKFIRSYIQEKYLDSKKTPLIILADRDIPFANSQIYRVRDISSHRGWTVWLGDGGKLVEVNKTGLKPFLKSIAVGLVKMRFTKKDAQEATRLSQSLMNHLGTSRRTVNCRADKDRAVCELTFLEGPFARESAVLKFDFTQQFILLN